MTAGSFAFGWALVPLYDVFCKVAGIGNAEAKAGAVEVREAVDPNREVTVEFIADPAIGGQLRVPARGAHRCACIRASSTTRSSMRRT